MSEDAYTIVKSFDGLYDEESKAVTHHISKRKPCLKHHFINASLYWESPHDDRAERYYHVSIECPVEQKETAPYITKWGVGYGGIRYCERCLLIDCIHLWDSHMEYRVEFSPFAGKAIVVSKCRACGRRICTAGWGYHNPSKEAWALINEVHCQARGCDFPDYMDGGYGSGFYCELPSAVSQMIATGRTEEARALIWQSIAGGIPDSVIRRDG